MRRLLLLSAALPALGAAIGFALPAAAQVEIETELTDPIDTQTIDGGNPADIIILNAGSVLIGAGQTAVTLNSDNTVTNQGTISSTDADNTTGILVSGTVTGDIINSGAINLQEDFTGVDDDEDGDFDTPFAMGTGRVGILVETGSIFTGNILNDSAGQINIEGNDSAGILVAGNMIGNLTSNGTINMVGDRSYAVSLTGSLDGNVVTSGRITTLGEGSNAVNINGDVTGTVQNTASIVTTGFRTTTRASLAARDAYDTDDLLNGGSAMAIGGNVGGGIINDAITDENNNTARGNLQSFGSAPTLLVTASLDGTDNGDINIGAFGTVEDDEFFGVINRGQIAATGLNDGFAATGIRIEGSEVGGVLRQTTIEGGLLSSGTIIATSFEANSTAISIGRGAVVPVIDLRGAVETSTLSQIGGRAAGIVIEAGAQVNELRINTRIQSSYTGTGVGGFAAGVVDESGTVNLLVNNGRIITLFTELVSDGNVVDPTDTTRRRVAVDLTANTTGATLQQISSDPGSLVALVPEISGDILFGSGGDTLELAGGSIAGDVLFGDGADLLMIDNGAELTGAIYDTDGQLTLDIRNGLLALGADTNLSLTSATFGTDARLQLTIDPAIGGGFQSASFNASGNVTFLTGSRIAPVLSGLIRENGTFNLITASNFSFAENFADMLDSESLPFLYNVDLSQAVGANTLVVTLTRRSAAELGMNINQSAAYEAWFEAIVTSPDDNLTTGFAGLATADEFYAAYNQLLPEFGAAALQFTRANTDGSTGAVSNRLDALRRGYGDEGGVWVQEIGYYIDRIRSSVSQPYSGYGLGLAIGVDRPMAGFDAVGFSLSGFSNQMNETQGFDNPLSSVSVQAGLYAGKNIAGIDFVAHSAIGLDNFDSRRVLNFGSIERETTGSWLGYHISSTARLSKDFNFNNWLFSPSVSLDYLRLTEEGYKETGGGVGLDLALDSRVSENLSATATFTVGRRFGNERSWWSPRLRAGIRNDMIGDPTITSARFVGFNDRFSLTEEQLAKTGLLFGLSFTAGSRYTSFGFDFDADIRDGFTRHTGKIVIRFIF
ncbi:MAG: autotransporter domain-containing protein [Robiginitomaculum sp.]|nr:autotransporter domain-containing protein [Robiginitomaculum sp.]